MRRLVAGGVCAAGACVAALLIHRWLRRHKSDTRQLESSAGACTTCEASLYLDAASEALVCPACECATARPGPAGATVLDDQGSVVEFMPRAFAGEAAELMAAVWREVEWEQHDDRLADGSVTRQPRLIAYQATPSLGAHVYSYPGIVRQLTARPFTPTLDRLRRDAEAIAGCAFNSAHCNLYRDGGDHVSWHTDEDEKLYGDAPTIASVSLGAARTFTLRRMDGPPYAWRPAGEMVEYRLEAGALLVMRGATQRHWEHSVRKDSPVSGVGPRINITFRKVVVV